MRRRNPLISKQIKANQSESNSIKVKKLTLPILRPLIRPPNPSRINLKILKLANRSRHPTAPIKKQNRPAA
jgi:hypothetical protein